MKKRIALSIALIIALLGTVVFATEYLPSNDVSEADKAAGIMPLSADELTPSVDADELKNTTVVSDDDATTYSIPEEWRRDVTEDMWRDEGGKKAVSNDHFQAEEALNVSDIMIDGNAFYAGQDVTIKNIEVYGDLFVAGKSVSLEKVYVSGNIYAAGQDVAVVNSNIVGNAYVAGEKLSLITATIQDVFGGASEIEINKGSTVYRNINVAANKVTIDNTEIGRNANVGSDNISVGSATTITGDLNYYSEGEASIAQGASIANINHSVRTPVEDEELEEESPVKDLVMNVAAGFVKAILVCGFIFLYAKGFVEKQKVENPVKHLTLSIVKGLLWIIVVPIISILLFCTGVGVGLGFAILFVYIASFVVTMPVVAVAVSSAFLTGKEVGTWKAYGMAMVVAIAIVLLSQIPGFGAAVSVVVTLSGMGLIFSSLKPKKENRKAEPVVTEEA